MSSSVVEAVVPDWAIALIIAPAMGSFAGVIIDRLPQKKPFLIGRSACKSCDHPLSWRDLVPMASYLALQGKCRFCEAKIAAFHFGVESAALGIAIWAIAVASNPPELWLNCFLGWSLLILAWIDIRHHRLPDVLTLPLIGAGIIVHIAMSEGQGIQAVLGALCGYACFWIVSRLYRVLRGREGLGLGDAKLLAAAGAWTGWDALPTVIVLASSSALAGAITISFVKKGSLSTESRIAFGPFIAIALWIVRVHELRI